MNAAPDILLWAELAIVIGGGTALIVGAAFLLARSLDVRARRRLWQAANLCLAALALGELSGSAPLVSRVVRLSFSSPEKSPEKSPGLARPESVASGTEADRFTPRATTSAEPVQVGAADGRLVTESTVGLELTPSAPSPAETLDPIEVISPPPENLEALALGTARPGADLTTSTEPATVHVDEPDAARSGLWWPGMVWLAGAALLLARALFAWGALGFVCRRSPSAPRLATRTQALSKRLGFERPVRVLESAGLSGPLATGALRPTILLPARFEEDYEPAQQDAMLLHELAHLRGHDPAWHTLSDLVTIALWWHPLAWQARHELRVAAEFVADEASSTIDGGPDALAASLVLLGRRLTRPGFGALARAEGSGFRSGLGRRVESLLRLSDEPRVRDPSARRRPYAKTAACTLLVAALVSSSLILRPLTVDADLSTLEDISVQGDRTMTKTILPLWKRSLAGLTVLAVLGGGAASEALESPGQTDPATQESQGTSPRSWISPNRPSRNRSRTHPTMFPV